MHSDRLHETTNPLDAVENHDLQSTSEPTEKKAFIKPALIRHDTLPKVTTGFFGTFP